jgi:sigma-B regulation protein RsbU (phosphoserine phosphatase)
LSRRIPKLKLGIKAKFIGILLIAAVLPLAIGLAAIWVLGYRDLQHDRGVLFELAASHLALGLTEKLQTQIEELNELSRNPELAAWLSHENNRFSSLSGAEISNRVTEIDARWPGLPESDPELQTILTNALSQSLGEYRARHPFLAEILVTDVHGQLAGATEKTSDYWQADEAWWQEADKLQSDQAWLEGVSYDESARVHSIDIALPVFDPAAPARPVGIIKGVLNATPLFFSVEPILDESTTDRHLVLGDGRILIALAAQEKVVPLQQRVNEQIVRKLARKEFGWMIASTDGGPKRLIGYARVMAARSSTSMIQAAGLTPLYVIVHEDLAAVMFPVRRQLWLVTLVGGALLFSFSVVGLYVATVKIIRPIRTLRLAAQTVTAASDSAAPAATVQPLEVILRQVSRITTRDEIQHLAEDFLRMAKRILRYQDQLNDEIAIKTAEIQRDLEVAREFQEALMPRSYPEVPTPPQGDGLCLNFHHVYLPTSSVGGDFFDVIKLSDHRAGIFIADVMGHGARSALVTAILRTLLLDFAGQANDPAQFLSLLNRHFSSIIKQSNQFIFVSAFYLLIDTERAVATFAAAGHPPPLVADRGARRVMPLIEKLVDNPALGVFPESTYMSFSRLIKANDVFLLFTDGAFETMNRAGEEFGHDRLRAVVERSLDAPMHELTQDVMAALDEFRGTQAPADDICLVACEIRASKTAAQARATS